MSDEWGSAAIVVAIAAAGISFLSAGAALWAAWVSHRMLKRQTETDKPTIECQLFRIEAEWLELRIILENPTTSSWVGRRLRVLSPKGARVGNWSETHTQDDYGGAHLDLAKLAAVTTVETSFNIEVRPAGSGASSWSGQSRGDRNWGSAYIRPPDGASKLKMELLVGSLDGISRREKYRIVREVPKPSASVIGG